MRGLKKLFLAALLLLCLPLTVHAQAARDISGPELVTESSGIPSVSALFDGDRVSGRKTGDGACLTLQSPEGFGSAYLIFDREYGAFTVTDEDTGETQTVGQEGFLHTFLDLEALFGHAPQGLTLRFENGPAALLELTLFTPGEVPDWVQRWAAPVENGADLVLFSTHADDEQLFFAGVLPYYAGERGDRVQVVYMTNHRNITKDGHLRCHEALDGLWAVGVRNYPVFGGFADYYCKSLKDAVALYSYMGVEQEELLGYVVEQLRRFKPLVAVGHDLNGEYGHGGHMLYADLLTQAVELATNPECFPESAQAYGTWDTPKVYLHLYEENQITMDWDKPLEHFGGMTAFEVTKTMGFPCHKSQTQDFAWYMSGMDRAADIPKYSPCLYGLYRTTVGPDRARNDFFENLTTYEEQEQASLEQQRLEQERLEEEKRQEAKRLEEERQTKEPAPETTEAPQQAEPNARPLLPKAAALMILPLLALTAIFLGLRRKKK